MAMATSVSRWMGLSRPIVVTALGVLLVGLAVAGLLAARTDGEHLRGRLRLQAGLNVGFAAALVGTIVFDEPNVSGSATLAILAAAVLGLAVLEATLDATNQVWSCTATPATRHRCSGRAHAPIAPN